MSAKSKTQQAEAAACKEAAADAARDFIRSPDTFQFDLLDTPALQQLRSDKGTMPVFTLLSLLLAGDVQVGPSSYRDFRCVHGFLSRDGQKAEMRTRCMDPRAGRPLSVTALQLREDLRTGS